MNTNKKTTGMGRKALLSTLWIFELFNMTFLDIHAFLKPGFLEQVMTGIVNGTQMGQEILLLGAIMMEIPIAMILLSRVLKYRINRWANIIAAVITIAIILGNLSTDPDNIFVGTIIVGAMTLIIWYSCKWPKPELSPNTKEE